MRKMVTYYARGFLGTLALILSATFTQISYADTIAMIGTGAVGSALGKNWSNRGHTIVYGSRDPARESTQALVAATGGNASAKTPAEAVVGADVVVIAVPWAVGEEVVAGLGDLSGKIVIDPTNPRDINEAGLSVPPSLESSTEKFKKIAPNAFFAKTLNHIPAEFMEFSETLGLNYHVSVAGDEAAVNWVTKILTDMSFVPALIGGVRETRLLEAFYSSTNNMRVMGNSHTIQFGTPPVR
ncbi:MAG: NAD(P)-binding domain-containing protein [Arenicellaceae bacterium]|nr:NAD(P)-binding domain-containing protein [Arenicellaceae bacterium]